MLKNLIIYDCQYQPPSLDALSDILSANPPVELSGQQSQSLGFTFVSKESKRLVLSNPGHLIVCVRLITKDVPGNVINSELEKKMDEFEQNKGYPMPRRQKRQVKEEIKFQLLPKAFAKTKDVNVWFDLSRKRMHIDTSSEKVADEVVVYLSRTLESNTSLREFAQKPESKMTEWVRLGDICDSLELGDRAVLKTNPAEVRFNHHDLTEDTVQKHIVQGKKVTELGLCFKESITFRLKSNGHIAGIKFIDVEQEATEELSEDASMLIFVQQTQELINTLEDLCGAKW